MNILHYISILLALFCDSPPVTYDNTTQECTILNERFVAIRYSCTDTCSFCIAYINKIDTIIIVAHYSSQIDTNLYETLEIGKSYKLKIHFSTTSYCDTITNKRAFMTYRSRDSAVGLTGISTFPREYIGKELLYRKVYNKICDDNYYFFYYTDDIIGNYVKKGLEITK